MICPYCHRSDIPMAPPEVQVRVPTRGLPPLTTISFSALNGMCEDCARVTSFFIQKGAMAFGNELQRMKTRTRAEGRQLTMDFLDEIHRAQAEMQADAFIKRIGFRIT